MGTTTTFEKGGGLIAVTGIMQTMAVIVNIIACWRSEERRVGKEC